MPDCRKGIEILEETLRNQISIIVMEWDIPVCAAIGVLHMIANDIHDSANEIGQGSDDLEQEDYSNGD